MNVLQRFAFTRIRSFRREDGGLYGAYVAVYSRIYRACMRWRHRGTGWEPLSGGLDLDEYVALHAARSANLQAHCRLKGGGYCSWCGAGDMSLGRVPL